MRTTRRDFLKTIGSATAFFSLPGCVTEDYFAENKNRPNILFILADDLGFSGLGCTGSDLHQTPNLDAFANESMYFKNAHTSHPTCAPSRLGIMTGKHPARFGVVNNHVGTSIKNEVTLAQSLKKAGYATCHIGKWHLGNDEMRPESKGYDTVIGTNGGGMPASYFYPFTAKQKSMEIYNVPDLKEFKPGDHLVDCLAKKATDYIKQNKNKPFFMSLWHYAVHTPLMAKEKKVKKYEKLLRSGLRHDDTKLAGLAEHLDDSIGELLKTLDEQGIADNTIVIFFSDNGGVNTSNYPLRGQKGTLYEGGTRVPLLIRWKGVTKSGTSCDRLIVGHDLYPTMLSMAGIHAQDFPKGLDGMDIVPLLKNPKHRSNRDEFHWLSWPLLSHYNLMKDWIPSGSVRKGDWKLIENYETPDGRSKHGYELYNLKKDISEMNNLADSMPDKVDELKKLMIQWHKDAKTPVYDKNMYKNKESVDA